MLQPLARTTRTLDRLGIWATSATGAWAGMSWMSKQFTAFGVIPWPEAIVTGLFLTVGLAGLVFWALERLYRYRTRRDPPAVSKATDVTTYEQTPTPMRDFDELIGRVAEIDKRLTATITIFGERLTNLEKARDIQRERNELIKKQIDTHAGTLAAQQHIITEANATAVRTAKDDAAFRRVVEQALHNTWNKLEQRCESIDQGFLAILDRERLLDLANEIAEQGQALSGPTRHERLDNEVVWATWFDKFQEWRVKVRGWARVASIYRVGTDDRVNATTEDDYRGTWTALDCYFPNAQAVQDYKTFRILLRNFHAERKPVDSVVQSSAFMRPSMKGRFYPSPRDGDQMLFPPPEEV